jgi:hypothetical protein
MLRRTLLLLSLAAPLLAAAPASADFHGACTPSGSAGVGLTHGDGVMTFAGEVRCGTASSIEMTSLVLIAPDGSQAAAEPRSCGPCDALSAQGAAPAAGPGRYSVAMRFDVTVGTQTFTNKSRSANFDWDGSGQPVRVSTSAPTYRDFCSTPGGDAVGFDADPFPALGTATFSGTVACTGVDEIRILERASAARTARSSRRPASGRASPRAATRSPPAGRRAACSRRAAAPASTRSAWCSR